MDPALWELLDLAETTEGAQAEAIVRLRYPDRPVPHLRIVARFGHIATCRLPARLVPEVRRHPNVVSLKAPRRLSPDREIGPADHPPSWSPLPGDVRRPAGTPLTGTGVVVGIVDWGLDFDHPSFRTEHGSTRLLALWDQRDGAPGPVPEPYGYGAVHVRRRIDEALRTGRPYAALGYHPGTADRGGGSHGTHVADIASGNGRAGGPVGVAPESGLVFVHLADRDTRGRANLGDSVRLLEAVDFIARTAAPRPWVVNISVGRHGGPHDGTTLVEMAFDELLAGAPGRFIVQSTGNYYRARAHACGHLVDGRRDTFGFLSHVADTSTNELEIWYPGQDEVLVTVRPPGAPGRPVPLGQQAELTAGGRLVGRIYHRAGDPNNGDNHVDAFLYPRGTSGLWEVTLDPVRVSDGRWHAWLERDETCPRCQARFTSRESSSTFTTGTIANGRLPLVVGAYDAHAADRGVAAFSSSGPTRDARLKPDLLAPGVRVLAARSAALTSDRSAGALVRKSGTSMATPHVTGAVALCLQAGGAQLSAAAVRDLVLRTAEPTPSTAEHRTGAGLLDLPRLVAALQQRFPPPSPEQPKEPSMDTEPFTDTTTDPVDRLRAAPADAYRQLRYRPHGDLARWIEERFTVIGRPGRPMGAPVQPGDVLLQVRIGHRDGGSCRVLEDAASAPRRLAAGQVLLRPLAPAVASADGEEQAAPATSPTTMDTAAAVPPFTTDERRRVAAPLLSPRQLADGVAWSRSAHPASSGVTLDDLRTALTAYVDLSTVRAALERRSQAAGGQSAPVDADTVLVEAVHQFQVKCYLDPREHDGRAGETTLDSLGFITRAGMQRVDRGHTRAQQRLEARREAVDRATGGEFTAANWFRLMCDPSVFGLRTKNGTGFHVALVRRLRVAERYLLSLPAYRGLTPVALAAALGISEKHGGARPSQTTSTSVHTFGLAIDIAYRGNPWVRRTSSWRTMQRAALLLSGVTLSQRSAPAYFSSLGSDPARSTGQVWDEIQQRNAEMMSYFGLLNAPAELEAALVSGQGRGIGGLFQAGETLPQAVARWRATIEQDRRRLRGEDFRNHADPEHGFLTHRRDLVIALRDRACLAWGAVDLGPGSSGSGDIMHFDHRVDGVGRVLTERTAAFVPSRGHPCLAATGRESLGEEQDAEGRVDNARSTIQAQARHWGTDEAAVMAALRALTPAEMAELMTDTGVLQVLHDELSGTDLAAASTQLARGRVTGMARADVDRILAAPARFPLGTLAAAMARDVLLRHHAAFDATGTGTIHGNRCQVPQPAGTTSSDCTEYVKDVLNRAFAAKGQGSQWADVLRAATRRSGSGGLKGTEVIRALQDLHGWEAVFWSPDPRDPQDGQSEHPYAYRVVREKGTYYSIRVDRAKSVVNYRRTNPANPTDTTGLERLKRLQFGVLAARGGTHMAMIVNADVYEVHWTSPATDRNAVEATPLANFAWQSGAIAAPAGDLARSWATP